MDDFILFFCSFSRGVGEHGRDNSIRQPVVASNYTRAEIERHKTYDNITGNIYLLIDN